MYTYLSIYLSIYIAIYIDLSLYIRLTHVVVEERRRGGL